jgi:hypothetical protein
MNVHHEQCLAVDELAALPAGRAIVFASGSLATLGPGDPLDGRPYADRIPASLARFDPGAPPHQHRADGADRKTRLTQLFDTEWDYTSYTASAELAAEELEAEAARSR